MVEKNRSPNKTGLRFLYHLDNSASRSSDTITAESGGVVWAERFPAVSVPLASMDRLFPV